MQNKGITLSLNRADILKPSVKNKNNSFALVFDYNSGLPDISKIIQSHSHLRSTSPDLLVQSRNVVYVAQCMKCNLQYVGSTSTEFTDSILVLTWCTSCYYHQILRVRTLSVNCRTNTLTFVQFIDLI